METILLQETDKDILEILTIALQMDGFIVHSVLHEDHDFLGMIDELRPHVVILDYRLDGKKCVEICHKIKAKYPHLPVIAISCNTNIDEVYDKKGFDGYIKKPFDIDMLYTVLRKHMPLKEKIKTINNG